jgi:predicted nucleic acid-binding protein
VEVVSPARLAIPVCRDPDDDDVLAGCSDRRLPLHRHWDQDLLVLERYEGIAIVAPGDFAAFESTMHS